VRYLEKRLQTILEENKIAGMAVALTDRKQVIYAKGFGVDNAEYPEIPAKAEALYRIASITKIITGITVMRLVEEGVLDLDVLVKHYVSWLRFSRPEALEQMTLRHLLSHTSGLPKEYTPEGPREESALEQTLQENLDKLEMHALPNEGVYLYSNWGIRLASYIAQSVTGKLFSQLAEEYVLRPLEMCTTTFDLREAATYPLSLPHEMTDGGAYRVVHRIKENAARLAAGGLYSNVFDLCKLARFFMNGGKTDAGVQLLKGSSMLQMQTVHARSNAGLGDGYGLTLWLRKYQDRYLLGHPGSAPPYATSVFADVHSGYGVVTLMNTQRDALRYQIPEMILDNLSR